MLIHSINNHEFIELHSIHGQKIGTGMTPPTINMCVYL